MKLSSTLLFLSAALNAVAVAQGAAQRARQVAMTTVKTGVTFAEDARHLPYNLLMGLERGGGDNDNYQYDDHDDQGYVESGYEASPYFEGYQCAEDGGPSSNLNVDVVLAISECVDDKMMGTIEDWVASLKAPFKGFVTFSTTLVPGTCQSLSESTKRGVNDDSVDPDTLVDPDAPVDLLAQDKAASNMARLQPFAKFGQVLEAPSDLKDVGLNPTVLISFVTDDKSYTETQGLELELQFQKTFNFQICREGVNCEGHFETCTQIRDEVDLFAYMPLEFTRRISCEGVLEDSLPIRYVTEENERGCYCACPAGYTKVDRVCTPVDPPVNQCPWTQVDGYRKEICHAEDTCEFKGIASNWKVPVPFPIDAYVADDRDNIDSDNNPRIDVVVTKLGDPVYKYRDIASRVGSGSWPESIADVPTTDGLAPVVASQEPVPETYSYEWKDYQKNSKERIDGLTFTAFGKYSLAVDAFDYIGEAQCPGCLAIVDKVRPQHTTQCPASFCDEATDGSKRCESDAEITEENLKKAQDLIANFYNFGEKATNDNCDQSERCDKQKFELENFFGERSGRGYYGEPAYEEGKKCFDTAEVMSDFINSEKATKNPLANLDGGCRHREDNPVKPGQCKRCCSLHTELRELWTDYKCGYDYDTRKCSGDPDEECSFKQCLVFNGDSVATATATINEEIAEQSAKVLEHVDQKGFNTVTQVHRALKCTEFNKDKPECTYTAKLSDLIDASATFKFDMGDANVNDYVFWRYQIRGEQWELWKNAPAEEDDLTFVRPETMITIEAWTQCGKVRTFYFYVHLHLDSVIKVCDHFSQMWYQSTVSLLKADDAICAYPGSDFAELTFDYHANIGLQYARDRTHMNISHVSCVGSLDDRESTTILDISGDNVEIVKRFGVELVNKDTTLPASKFAVTCTFTYKDFNGDETLQLPCTRQFEVKDCQPPNYDDEENCEWTGCAGNYKPGLFEACGGEIIRAKKDKTYVDSVDKECCQGCGGGKPIECVSLLKLPNSKEDLMRCEPVADSGTTYNEYDSIEADSINVSNGGGVQVATSTALSAASSAAQEHPGATALLAASAMVAVVALIAVKRRANSARMEQAQDDAYYPMLY